MTWTDPYSLSSMTFPFATPAPAAVPRPLPDPVPNPELTVAPPAAPPWHRDVLRHQKQIMARSRQDDERLMTLAALGVSTSVRADEGGPLVAPVGTFTYFVLRRTWVESASGRPARAVVLAGYKSAFRATAIGPSVTLGGPLQNACLYDLRFPPVVDARPGGRIIDVRKYTTLRTGLDLDAAVAAAAADPSRLVGEPRLPTFWAGFRPDELPDTEDCPAARRAALAAVRPGEDGPTLPSLRALGGTVSVVVPDADGGTAVGFGGDADNPDEVQVLPRTAVLRPYVRPGVVVAPGATLGDFLPRRVYPSMARVSELYGEDVAGWLLQEAAASGDEMHNGLVLRRVELCQGQLGRAVQVFEDVRDLVGPDRTFTPQVFRARRPAALVVDRGIVRADLHGLQPKWSRPFEPAARRGKGGDRGES